LIITNIKIINYYNQYFVFPRDFLKNINTAISEKKLEEFSFYLSNKVDEFREPIPSFNIANIKKIITKNLGFLNEKKIKQIRLFGSAIDGTYHNQSDIDIIIEFDCDMLRYQKKIYLCDFANFFSEKFGRAIDIHDLSEFDTSSNAAYLSSIIIWNN
ncbi:MAG: nucleotidyltransferase domain-containing protein, partial [Anaeroplasmataceae bacterium]|nr:nucleotidyltransferase domain-containing protein [Anaeroplasmataceae bacterium]